MSRRRTIISIVLLLTTLLAFVFMPAFSAQEEKLEDVTPSPSPLDDVKKYPGKKIDPFKGERPSKFDFDRDRMKELKFKSHGADFKIPGYVIKDEEVLLPLDNWSVKKTLSFFNTTVSYDEKTGIITFTRDKDKEMRMKIDYDVVDYIGVKKKIPVPPRIIEGKPYISPASFCKFIWAFYREDDKTGIYYLDSWVLDVFLETTKRGKVLLVARGSGKLKYRILKLTGPTRFVIDVMDAVLDGKAGEIHHPTLGAIRYSQHELMGKDGNIVRIVVPESEEVEIVMMKSRADDYVEANLRPRQISAPVQGMAIQQIKSLKIYESGSRVTVDLDTTGPVQIEWSRLLDPDNRFFIDIPGMIFPEKKKDYKLNSDFVPKIRVAQFEPKPNPVVRMVLELEKPQKVTIDTDNKNPKRVKIHIDKETIDPDKAARKGYIITYYPSKGLVICIDPGHGGSDPGAVNRKYGVYEKEITLDISRRLAALLKKEGWTVVMTRTSDRDVSYAGSPDYEELGSRVRIPNDLKAHVFISVHINASVRSSVNGVATYWYKWIDKSLAQYVQSGMIEKLRRTNLGIRRERFFMLCRSNMPAVLVEVGFLSNPTEAKLLKDPKFRQKAAEGIMQGLRVYAHKMNLKKKK